MNTVINKRDKSIKSPERTNTNEVLKGVRFVSKMRAEGHNLAKIPNVSKVVVIETKRSQTRRRATAILAAKQRGQNIVNLADSK